MFFVKQKEEKYLAENIRVTTQNLKEKQEEWLILAAQAKKAFLAAADNTEKLENCFSGRPVHSLNSQFRVIRNEGERAFGILHVHLEKLSRMATVYDEAERSNTDVFTDN